MLVADLVRELSRPSAFGHPVDRVLVVQTHVSVVFLAGELVYKVKKPLDLGFLDYSTPAKRRAACHDEIRLNERLAPGIYLGVVPVLRIDGGLRFGEAGAIGDVVDHAVLMRRLPADRTLDALLGKGLLDEATLVRVARRLADFHAGAETGPAICANASFDGLARVVRENLRQVERFRGGTLHPRVHERLVALTESELAAQRRLVDDRTSRGIPRDAHGDLRLEHVYVLESALLGDEEAGAFPRVLIVDCIEFSDRLRHADPIADAAFLVMDLEFAGRRDLARTFLDAWIGARDDEEARALVPLHVGYRHVVRGKVRSIESIEPEVEPRLRERAAERASGHFLAALVRLAPPGGRPCLLLAGGLPGTGKSTIARGLGREAGFVRISSDEIRKALAGMTPATSARAGINEGIYSAGWTERTYADLLRRADELILAGQRVVVDASWHDEACRVRFVDLARRRRVPALFLECAADPEKIRTRLGLRRGDASDADWNVYLAIAARWQPCGPATEALRRALPTGPPADDAIRRAISLLAREGLA